ncbi:hypothetical protein AWENTII_003313 [Aspergillus wentii]|nr:hypothetical protein MW887_012015 [Aspergillus wentii]
MKLLLIRHAECGHNLGQAAGNTTGHTLTDNGKTQVQLLARHLRDRGLRFTRVFSSDLDRVTMTAEGICQQQLEGGILTPVQISELREQSMGWLDDTRWRPGVPASSVSSPDSLRGGQPTYTDEESMASMRSRANNFLENELLPLVEGPSGDDEVVAVVAHGMILQVLWVCLADLFNSEDISLAPGVSQSDFGDYIRPVWSNTGIMEIAIQKRPPAAKSVREATQPSVFLFGTIQLSIQDDSKAPLSGWYLIVLSVDNTLHLENEQQVGRTRWTVQETVPESRQDSMDQFCGLTGTA